MWQSSFFLDALYKIIMWTSHELCRPIVSTITVTQVLFCMAIAVLYSFCDFIHSLLQCSHFIYINWIHVQNIEH